jgi:organic hydroperoxide reductase OsmC/OhrA
MLFFLLFAAGKGLRVDDYEDRAEGVMGKNAAGRTAMARVTLRPRVSFSGEPLPTRADIEALHHRSHEECFIANSVTTEVRVEPEWQS